MRIVTVIMFVSLISCTHMSERRLNSASILIMPTLIDENKLGTQNKVPSLSQIFTLSNEQQSHFLEYFNSQEIKNINPNLRVYKYLQNRLTNFNNYADTLIASEALNQGSGNCLSLAILTKSLTMLTNIPIQYEIVETAPIYQMSGDVLLVSKHIRTTLLHNSNTINGRAKTSQKDISIDYYPTDGELSLKTISENEFYSMYYTNIAADYLTYGNNEEVYWFLKKALELYPKNLLAVNMMGIVHKRLGYLDLSERLYLYGLSLNENDMTILNNYHTLLKRQNREQEALAIKLKLKKHVTNNPFYWIELADNAYALEDHSLAIKYYKKAQSIAHYLHQPYAGIAQSKKQQGKIKAARVAINAAIKNLHTQDSREKFKDKYQQILLSL